MENWAPPPGRCGREEITSSGPTPLKTVSHSSPAREDKDTLSRCPSKTKRREIEPHRRNLLHFVLILRVGRQKEETRASSSSAARREDTDNDDDDDDDDGNW